MKQFATITVIGRDKTGVVARITNFLFEHGANIEALEEQVTRGQFSMVVQAAWAGRRWDGDAVHTDLRRLAGLLQREINMHLAHRNQRQRFAIMVTKEPHALE